MAGRRLSLIFPGALAFFLGFGVVFAHAGDGDPTPVIDVSETALPEDSSVFMAVIDVAEEAAKSKTVADLLESSAGLNVKRYGGLGSYSVAMIRGSSANQVMVYLDGVPMNSAKNGVVNLGDLSIANLEKVEVYRGFTPPGFAVSGIGGVINLVTKKGRGEKSLDAVLQYGSFNTWSANATYYHPADAADFLLHFDTGHSDGDYPFKNDNGTPFNSADDSWDLRENNAYDYHNLMGRVNKDVAGWAVSLFDDFYSKRMGVPGLGNNQSKNAGYEVSRNTFNITLDNKKTAAADVVLTARAYNTYSKEKFTDRGGEIGVGNQDNQSVSVSTGVDLKLEAPEISSGQYVVVFASASRDTFEQKNFLLDDPGEPRRARNKYTLVLLDEIYVGDWLFSPSVRYERFENDFGGKSFFPTAGTGSTSAYEMTSPRLGLSCAPLRWLTFNANVGRYFRAPDMTELFGDRGVVVGNSGLEPEEGVNFDIGFKADFRGMFFEAAFFRSETENLITYVQNSQRTSIARNIGKAVIIGLETAGAVKSENGLSLSFNYTYQKTEDRSALPHYNGNQLPNRPENDLFIKAERSYDRFKAFYGVNYTDRIFLDRANFKKISARTIHSAGVSARLPVVNAEATFEIKNMTDDQLSDALGYPLPGRSYFFTLKWTPDF